MSLSDRVVSWPMPPVLVPVLLGVLLAVVTAGWFVSRAALLEQVGDQSVLQKMFVFFIRFTIPVAMLSVALWWLLTDALGIVSTV